MKKNIIIAALAAATALFVSASCTKQDTDLQVVSGAKVFTASIAQVQTKTSLGTYEGHEGHENVIFWDKRDSILINKETFYSAEPNSEKPEYAEFLHCGGPEPKAPYEAIFPASLYVDNGYMQGYCFPQFQEYRAGKFNAPMYATSEDNSLIFKNICGVICFSLKGTEKIKSIELTSKAKDINGVFKIDKKGENDYTAVIDLDAEGCKYDANTKTVTLDCGKDGVQLSKTDSTNFFIYLPETSFEAGDLSVRVTTADGKLFEKTATSAVTVQKNNVYTFNWEVDATLLHTLATFFRGLSEDQARLAAATDEAMSEALIEQYKNNPQKLFLPEIHTWSNARPAILEIEKSLAKIDVVNLMGLTRPELMFLEAYLYFELARTYGQAPILSLDNPNPPTASLNELMNFIVKNAKEADILPEKYDPDKKTIELAEGIEMTRPTKWAAKALAGRTCLYASSRLFNYMNSFKQIAIDSFLEIINSGIVKLESDYSILWKEETAFDNAELIFGVRLAQNDAYKGIHPTSWLLNQFENDARKEFTFVNDESGLTIIKKPVSQIIPVFRYADILLMCSESTENVQYENMVLERVKEAPRPSYSLSCIIEDRMKELAFEGHRFWDVRRWQEGGNCFGVKFGLNWSEDYNFYPTPW